MLSVELKTFYFLNSGFPHHIKTLTRCFRPNSIRVCMLLIRCNSHLSTTITITIAAAGSNKEPQIICRNKKVNPPFLGPTSLQYLEMIQKLFHIVAAF